MIRLENITKSFPNGDSQLDVLKNFSLHIKAGELLAIIGQSGVGKTTLLNIMGLIESFDSGDLYINDRNIATLSEKERAQIRNKKIGFVVQEYSLIDYYTVFENIALPLVYAGKNKKEIKTIVTEKLKLLDIYEKEKNTPATLSGGQKQRVCIARAIANDPTILLADEPTGSLDRKTGEIVFDYLKKINHENGTTVVIVTHNPEIASACDRIVEL